MFVRNFPKDNKGFGDLYNQPAVDIAIQSSLFRGGNKSIMIQGILEAERKSLAISINKLKELPEVTEGYSEAQLVVSALCFVGQFFGFVVAVPRTKSNPLSATPFVWSPAWLGSLQIQPY